MGKEIRIMICAAVILAALASTACVPSIHPFYEDKDVYFDQDLLGSWTDAEGVEQWRFSRNGDLTYQVIFVDNSGKTGYFTARLFKLEGLVLMDLSPVIPDGSDDANYIEHFLPTHTLAGLEVEGDRARVFFLDPAWIKNYLKQNPSEIDHTVVDAEVVITAPTAKLQTFVRRHVKTRGAFGDTETLFKKGDK